jgi:hypothetical protein
MSTGVHFEDQNSPLETHCEVERSWTVTAFFLPLITPATPGGIQARTYLAAGGFNKWYPSASSGRA